MNKQTIKNKLYESHHSFISFLDELTDKEFIDSRNKKWTAAQQLEHIYLGVKPLRLILSMPNFLLKLIWGQANRESKSYEDLVKKYLLKLENGGIATRRFTPKIENIEKSKKLKNELKKEIVILTTKLDKLTEKEFDKYVIPHPLLGKLTKREMLYFTIFHVSHHEELMKRNLE